jgi:hypothetical protein
MADKKKAEAAARKTRKQTEQAAEAGSAAL